MKLCKKVISIALAFILVFTGLPLQFMNFDAIPYACAAESTPTVDLSYDNFANTENLQLNGDSLIEDNAIKFESGGGTGESVFTKDKVTLGTDLSFSTAFSFRNISPFTPAAGTKGGFTFTLQSVGNTAATNDFHDESIEPSLSIAFTSDYMETGSTASLIQQFGNLRLASLTGFKLAGGPITRCEISAVPYIDGDFNSATSRWPIDTYYAVDETSQYYNVWIGYDGVEKSLYSLCLGPSGEYTYFSNSLDLSDKTVTNEVYAGFMGSLGNAGNTSEIGSWYFKNDLSIIDEAIVDADAAWLTDEMEILEDNPVDNFFLPLIGQYGSTISWASSNTDVVAADGTVKPPSLEQGNQTVTLAATITKGSAERTTRSFTITVKVPDIDIVTADCDWLTNSRILNENDAMDNIVSDLFLPTSGCCGSTISWSSTNTVVVDWDGTVSRPAYYDGDKEVTLTAYITMNTVTLEKTFNITVKVLGMTDEDIMQADYSWLTSTQLLNGNADLNYVTADINLPTSGQYGSTISWTSGNDALVDTEGKVTRPAYTNGDETVTLTATVSKGAFTKTKEFTVTVKVLEQTDAEILEADKEWLTELQILNGNTSLIHVVGNLNLPGEGPNGSTISWESDNIAIVDVTGKVTRPTFTHGDEIVTLTATISKGSFTTSKAFTVTVIKLEQTNAEKLAADDLWLTEALILKENSALDNATGDLYLPSLGTSGSSISWSSSNPAVVNTDGTVARQPHSYGDQTVTLTAIISNGSSITRTFTVTVKALEQTDAEILEADKEWLTELQILNGNTSLIHVVGNLNLPGEGPNGSTISWESDNIAIVDGTGKVTRPTFTHGDEIVTLTATISKGSFTTTKAFTVIVKALEQTDLEAVNAAVPWLTDFMTGVNGSLDNVIQNITLPASGPDGVTISWASNNTAVVDSTGKVTRPTFTAGDKEVTLTATISKGTSATAGKDFTVIVKKLPQNAQEKVEADAAWLTDAQILNGNSALDNITTDLALPILGENGSNITWYSVYPNVVSAEGKVTRPSFTAGSKTVTITATITMGSGTFARKTFVLTVKPLDITDGEVVFLDEQWLYRYNILALNPSANSVTRNLSQPVSGPNNSSITWESDMPSVISNDGTVTRPENGAGHKSVKVTATLTKGESQTKRTFTCVVLEKPDTTPPAVVGTTPENNSTEVPWDINTITVTFSENIVRGSAADDSPQTFGIDLKASGTVRFDAAIEGNKLLITPYGDLSPGENRLIIPAGAVTDAARNPAEAYELKFTVEPKPVRKIAVVSATPQDLEKEVDINIKEIQIRFDSRDLVLGEEYYMMMLRDKRHGFMRSNVGSLTGDIATLKVFGPLDPGTVYEIVIPAGVVRDRFDNINEEKVIQFRTKYAAGNPLVISTSPTNGQTGVNVNTAEMEVLFSQEVKPFYHQFTLNDDKGNQYVLTGYTTSDKNKLRLVPNAIKQFRPNTVYTLSGQYGTMENPSQMEFNCQFTTSTNELVLESTTPVAWKREVPLDAVVEVMFSAPCEKGSSFADITIKDSEGVSVEFTGQEAGKKVILTPASMLSPSKSYTVTIPEEAFKGERDTTNDPYQFTFSTVNKLDLNLRNIHIPDMGFVNKHAMFDASEAENIARRTGCKIVSYEWSIDGEAAGTKSYIYHLFRSAGSHEVELTIKDNKGISYVFKKNIEIQNLTDIRMTIKDSELFPRSVIAEEIGSQPGLVYELKLLQEGQFIYGERILVELFKDGVRQRALNVISAQYGEDVYKFTFKPQYGEHGIYELEFTYKGIGYDQVIRIPVNVISGKPAIAEEFKFRLYDVDTAGYYEAPESLNVFLNGKKMHAVKKWYPDKNYYAYAIVNESIYANTYYEFQVEAWISGNIHKNVYVGKDTSDPFVIYGRSIKPEGIKNISVDYSESTVKDPYFRDLYFEGVSAKLVLNVEGDWKNAEEGYYEIKTWKDDKFILKVNCNNRDGIQKITLDPGLQLKAGDTLIIRMVTKYGVASIWYYCPYIHVITQPSFLGKELPISIQSGEYAVNWPTVFDGALGGTIGILDGIPVVGGGNFGIGSGMPKFEGYLTGNVIYPFIDLEFGISGGYGEKSKTKADTKYKKLKKVTVVGYEFEISVEGELNFIYNSETKEWGMYNFYILLAGDGTKEWSKGYEFMGIGFSAGVGIGSEVYGGLKIDNSKNKTQYSGIIGIAPHAYLRVSGDFVLARVDGYLNARLPAEIHFPTGYIGADIRAYAEIYARALLWGDYIYKKDLYKVHWDNGKEKVILGSLQERMEDFAGKDNTSLQLISRDYSNRQSSWLAGDREIVPEEKIGVLASLRSIGMAGTWKAAAVANPAVSVMMENIYPHTELQLIRNQDELWLVWSDDNPARDAVNRTQLRYSVLKDGAWGEPVWVGDDRTADFTPAVAAAGNGVLMAWHNIGKAVAEEEGLAGMLENSEISVTESVYTADGISPNIITLTNDDFIDHSPKLAADGDKALLVWTKSKSMGFSIGDEEVSESEKGNQLYFSSWNNSTWSAPKPVGDASSTVLDSSLSMVGEKGLLLYTLDMDNNLFTFEDREVFARLYEGEAWSEAIRLTSNTFDDSAPKAVYADGQWFITWLQEGNVLYKVGLNGETKAEERLKNIQGDYQLAAKSGTRPLISLVYMQPGEDKAVGISTSFYDLDNGRWGDGVSLEAGNKYADAISALFTEDGKLNVAFSQADIITEAVPVMIDGAEQLVEQPNVSNKVDMKLLTYTPVHDVALSEKDGIFLSTEFPLSGTVTTVYATLRNEGDFAENARICIYDGDPDDGGELIGEAPWRLIPARSYEEVEIAWLVGPEEKDAYDLYAVVQPGEGVQEINTDNNTLNLEFSTADLSITGLICENMAQDDYLVTATIANSGGKILEGATVVMENVNDDQILKTSPLKLMEPGQQTVLTTMVSSAGLARDGKGQINLRIRVNPPEGVKEDFTENNTRSFSLEPAAITVDKVNPGPGDKHVAPSSALSIAFNMNIAQDAGYDRIRLMDEDLNEIAVNKVIQGNTLTITPQHVLDNGTEYTLIIPADALGDAYGHSMKSDFSLSFRTVLTNPEIISAYPGEFMENTALDTDIRLKFNQKMLKGNNFSDICLFGPEDRMIPVNAAIEGEFLTLDYNGSLSENTTYSLEVPRGAVQNDNGEVLYEDYVLVFTTGDASEGDDGPGGGGNDKPSGEGEEDEDSIRKEEDSGDGDNNSRISIFIGRSQRIINIRIGPDGARINLAGHAADIFSGDESVVINIPVIPNVSAYTLEIPADSLNGRYGKASLTLNTGIGSITIPSGMLSGMSYQGGRTANITIAVGDKSKLPDDTKAAIGKHPLIQLILTMDGQQTGWNNPAAPVTVSIPYTPTAEELAHSESIIIWYIDGAGKVVSVPNGHYDPATGTVTFTTAHFSYYAVGYNKVSFNDVMAGAWYDKAVSFIAARNITTGTGGGNFSPEAKLTRGQFIVMMMRAYDISSDADSKDNFSDAGNTWYTGYLAAAKHLSISNGVGDNNFAPDREITRQEMLALLYNALRAIGRLPEGTAGKPLSSFSDAENIASWAKEATALLVETGIIKGNGGKLFPIDTTTRAEMAQMLYNLLSEYK
ncbi:immunoglobulin-like domain-containing protein [Lutispora sp.]|uniref:immunoglobulin-like domain-containing protein n=1 Tax=Lutispora sp. TaxID=2828727 RepID=UPI002B20DE14|nr:immunoglobulin-like domain-containing protein [Lutispora sp.]MEA4961635.1 immunoglobulin-like domain-containing protein [Lutispora sp.]